MTLEPYLFFNGRCEEAVNFYRDAIGAEVTALMRYKDSPESQPPGMLPPGCRFAPRCEYAESHCRSEDPRFVARATGGIACHFPLQKGGR